MSDEFPDPRLRGEWLDPRWEWTEIRTWGSTAPMYVRTTCNHLEVVPVESGGETVAHLCLTCDQQLPGLDAPRA